MAEGGGSPVKKFLIFALCTILLCLIATPVTADDNTTQTYKLTVLGDNTLVFSAEKAPTLWEKPTLKAGQYTTVSGMLTVHNSTSVEQKIGLRTVELPYDNEEALRYLNHVYITVRNGSKVLYEGPYSRINDDRDFNLNMMLAANQKVNYFIDLRCDYLYTGDGLAADDLIKWEFYAVDETPDDTVKPESFSSATLLEILLSCGIAVFLLGGIFVYDRFIKNCG